MKALVIDPVERERSPLEKFLSSRGYRTVAAENLAQGRSLAGSWRPELVFLDQGACPEDLEGILAQLRYREDSPRVIVTSADVALDRAVRAMKGGAEYYFPKPLDFDQVGLILDRVEERVRAFHTAPPNRYGRVGEAIVGDSPQMIGVRRMIGLLAKNAATPVLILGESGTGKQMIANEIHAQSGVAGPLVEINCASLTEAFLENELFGHEKGAFTDAKEMKKGLLEVADSGSVFFDEISEMPLGLQARLLKVLDSRKFRRIGGLGEITTNARFMAATNRDVASLVAKGLFREDLYYRISVLPVVLPPLRQRPEDIVRLAEHFARNLAQAMGREWRSISPDAARALASYSWPGNVRQLRNVVEHALILGEGEEILPEHLPRDVVPGPSAAGSGSRPALMTLRAAEEEHIRHVLRETAGNRSRAATILGISRSTLLLKLKQFGV